MARAFQQFSRFILGKEDLTQHHSLKEDQVRQSGQILKPLAGELAEPRQLLSQAEEPVGDVQGDELLARRRRKVQRP